MLIRGEMIGIGGRAAVVASPAISHAPLPALILGGILLLIGP
jgi:hypothetical protein